VGCALGGQGETAGTEARASRRLQISLQRGLVLGPATPQNRQVRIAPPLLMGNFRIGDNTPETMKTARWYRLRRNPMIRFLAGLLIVFTSASVCLANESTIRICGHSESAEPCGNDTRSNRCTDRRSDGSGDVCRLDNGTAADDDRQRRALVVTSVGVKKDSQHEACKAHVPSGSISGQTREAGLKATQF
jgi:hypothetical protein